MSNSVSNEMLYELLKAQEKRNDDLFALVKESKADINRRFEQLEANQREDRRKLEAIYDCRKQVTVQFTRSWIGASMAVATIAAFLAVMGSKAVTVTL